MKELKNIISAIDDLEKIGETAIATLVKVSGSTYRSPGARMLINNNGNTIGAISGGCLESDVFEKSQAVIESKNPRVIKYDTTSEEDMIWGLGLGCQGIAYVLIEPLRENQLQEIAFIKKCLLSRSYGAIARVITVGGETETQVGQRLLLGEDTIINNLTDDNLLTEVLSDTKAALQNNSSILKEYSLKAGRIEVFIEVIQPPLSLIVFGAGYDVLPLVNFGKQLGWDVTVVDNRQREASKKRFEQADKIQLCGPEEILDNIEITERTVAVVMSHNYLDDLEMLKLLVPSDLNYLGILGPKKRTNRILKELQAEGIMQNANIHSPVGLDIGADNAEEIALSIVSEIKSVISQRNAGFLRNRNAPIHANKE
ncbi:xanthine and CO dehydrogenases maturation factor, XdhC/CoxF family [Rivularia sp. PCC 7116]|uniref:XdhC family protein n=1 Tax=Rivularia sp. PCC 7116 TaxID=373994 RepID=UPI00029ED695|nr:XdhC/CoxI family protein [Rivularia sp. PCC 7116]AFY57953.1 xanthine and CO dehydrogenases maturation factor, XdhC/CoxF family [Rivularia sp. PCC 7116]